MKPGRYFSLFFLFCFSTVLLFSQNKGITVNNFDLPTLKFEENKNQFDSRVLYRVDLMRSGKLFLEKNAFTYLFWNSHEIEQMHHPEDKSTASDWENGVNVHFHSFKAELLGANPNPFVTSQYPLSYYKNYFVG